MKSAARTASPTSVTTYRAPWWLPGGHLQTIYARRLVNDGSVQYRRERWETPDGDFIDLDWLADAPASEKLVVLFHGLEGCSHSHYARALMPRICKRGWRAVVPHFRGCSGEPNRLPRSYHSGDSREIDWILRRLKFENPLSEIYAVGVSLGGNMLLKWLGEEGEAASRILECVAAVSVPMDLVAAAGRLDRGIHRLVYTRHFLQSLRAKVLEKISTHGLDIDPRAVRACSTFREIDDLYTAPFHGFKNAEDYWRQASSKPWLKEIKVPTLLVNARNDPFLPAAALPTSAEVSDSVVLEYTQKGGHVGFISGTWPGGREWLPGRICDFLARQVHGVNTSFTDVNDAPGFGPPAMT